jgi:hypothetical protein
MLGQEMKRFIIGKLDTDIFQYLQSTLMDFLYAAFRYQLIGGDATAFECHVLLFYNSSTTCLSRPFAADPRRSSCTVKQ